MTAEQMIRFLNDCGYVVLVAHIPDGNLTGVMLYRHHAAPHRVRDTFYNLPTPYTALERAMAARLGVEVDDPVTAQGETVEEALSFAADELGVTL